MNLTETNNAHATPFDVSTGAAHGARWAGTLALVFAGFLAGIVLAEHTGISLSQDEPATVNQSAEIEDWHGNVRRSHWR